VTGRDEASEAAEASPEELAEVVTPSGPEKSEPPDDDGQFNSQDMPTTDGEMADGGA
jgi:hypothetical protein